MGLIEERRYAQEFAEKIIERVKTKMYGMDDVIRLCLVALFVKKHVLLEGNPGLGKTSLVNEIAQTMSLDFRRIQFTPDLLPSDILITPRTVNINGQTTFELADGPIFTSLLLADEINRATQKTQAALLEAMGEKQVTINGETKRLDKDGAPFMVLATQNPVDHEGTYDLPEAQLDRFVFKIMMPTPTDTALRDILAKTAGPLPSDHSVVKEETEEEKAKRRAETIEKFTIYHESIREIPPSPSVQAHIENIFHATNGNFSAVSVGRSQEDLRKLVDMMRYGLGPRAATDLLISAKAWTLFFGVSGQKLTSATDIVVSHESLARIVIPVLRHRVKLNYAGREDFSRLSKINLGSSDLIDQFVMRLVLACIPVGSDFDSAYAQGFRQQLDLMKNRPY